ncbi:hypothetical protein DPEC_G00325810, partial [Dallia pectoralis]
GVWKYGGKDFTDDVALLTVCGRKITCHKICLNLPENSIQRSDCGRTAMTVGTRSSSNGSPLKLNLLSPPRTGQKDVKQP